MLRLPGIRDELKQRAANEFRGYAFQQMIWQQVFDGDGAMMTYANAPENGPAGGDNVVRARVLPTGGTLPHP